MLKHYRPQYNATIMAQTCPSVFVDFDHCFACDVGLFPYLFTGRIDTSQSRNGTLQSVHPRKPQAVAGEQTLERRGSCLMAALPFIFSWRPVHELNDIQIMSGRMLLISFG
ncbi:unnamed protein product [Victoria cruziana]